jgi:hypothetical protein
LIKVNETKNQLKKKAQKFETHQVIGVQEFAVLEVVLLFVEMSNGVGEAVDNLLLWIRHLRATKIEFLDPKTQNSESNQGEVQIGSAHFALVLGVVLLAGFGFFGGGRVGEVEALRTAPAVLQRLIHLNKL